MSEAYTCPVCTGSGKLRRKLRALGFGLPQRTQERDCGECKGTGQITEDHYRALEDECKQACDDADWYRRNDERSGAHFE